MWEGCPAFEGRLVLLQAFIDFCKTSHLLVQENAQKRGKVADLRHRIAPFQAATMYTAKWPASPGSGREDTAGLGESGWRKPPWMFYTGLQMACARKNACSAMHSFAGIIIPVYNFWFMHSSGPRSGPMCQIIKWQIKSVNRINWVDVILLIRWICSLLRWIRIH